MKQWNPGHFGSDFREGGTSYVQIPEEWHIRDESRVLLGHFKPALCC